MCAVLCFSLSLFSLRVLQKRQHGCCAAAQRGHASVVCACVCVGVRCVIVLYFATVRNEWQVCAYVIPSVCLRHTRTQRNPRKHGENNRTYGHRTNKAQHTRTQNTRACTTTARTTRGHSVWRACTGMNEKKRGKKTKGTEKITKTHRRTYTPCCVPCRASVLLGHGEACSNTTVLHFLRDRACENKKRTEKVDGLEDSWPSISWVCWSCCRSDASADMRLCCV